MDSTSLTRTLATMRRQGWIAERPGKDRRERRLDLSSAGKAQLNSALPVWEKVQSRLRHQLGQQTWNDLLQLTHQVAGLVSTKENRNEKLR
jgi:DNA-binding MarR family transcriptional regulator